MKAQFKIYYPMPRFPALSLSGGACELHCAHCNAAYLKGMVAAETPDALLQACRRLKAQGAVGVLLSGGSDRHGGIMNLPLMLDAIETVKRETGLLLNAHPGLLDPETAIRLRIDFASLEIPEDRVIAEVFGIAASREDYLETYAVLRGADIEVVPHITVYRGGEDQLLEGIVDPRTVVVIAFSPTRDTALASAPPPHPKAVGQVIAGVRERFPQAEVALGCMRPRERALREALELAALEAGATRMELPSRRTLAAARARGYAVRAFDACCALPVAFEEIAIRKDAPPATALP